MVCQLVKKRVNICFDSEVLELIDKKRGIIWRSTFLNSLCSIVLNDDKLFKIVNDRMFRESLK